jgi:hypothetical protein
LQAASWRGAWRFAEAAVISGNAADARSSWGRYELNPVLGRGTFGARQAAIKGISLAAILASQEAIARRTPAKAKYFALGNLAGAAVLGGAAWRNERTK